MLKDNASVSYNAVTPMSKLKPFPDNYFNGEEGSTAFLKVIIYSCSRRMGDFIFSDSSHE